MTITKKFKTTDKIIEQNEAQYELDTKTAKISALSSGNVCKYEFLTSKDLLLEKALLEKAATIKRVDYSPLGKELMAQTDLAKKEYQGLDKAFISNMVDKYLNELLIKKEKSTFKEYNKLNLTYNRLSFYSHSDYEKFYILSLNENIHIY